MYSWKESIDMCSYRCKYWSHDMEDSFCTHPEAMRRSVFGLSENAMIRLELCTGASDDANKNLRQLWEPRDATN